MINEHYRGVGGRLIDISGLIGCAGVMLLQWVIAFPLMGEKLYGQVWPPLAWFTGFLARRYIDSGNEAAVAGTWLHLHFFLWSLQVLVFASAYWLLVCSRRKLAPHTFFLLLLMQLAIAISDGDVLPKIFALELPLLFPVHRALKWLAAGWILAAVSNIPYLSIYPQEPGYVEFVKTYVGFIRGAVLLDLTFFAFGVLASKEKRGRSELEQAHAALAATHAELLATQRMLSDKVRASERMRIAGELHEAIDHRLSEQSRYLDLAIRQADETILASVTTARDLSVNLLNEIRRLVDKEQDEQSINLRQALEILCSGIPAPRIILSFDDSLDIAVPATANAIFRCVQEAISNTVRHANAATLQVSLAGKNDGISILIADDGSGAMLPDTGSGLAGMRERVAALGGKIVTGNRPEGGYGVDIWLPYA